MNVVTKDAFLDALRSGKYQQGRKALRDGDSFCCLGVYCDLVDPLDWEIVPDSCMTGGYAQFHHAAGSSLGIAGNALREDFCKTLGIHLEYTEEVTIRLAQMNDSEGKSLSEIADWLECDLSAYVTHLADISEQRYTTC